MRRLIIEERNGIVSVLANGVASRSKTLEGALQKAILIHSGEPPEDFVFKAAEVLEPLLGPKTEQLAEGIESS